MLKKVKAVFSIPDVLKQGKMLVDATAWKTHQVTANMIAVFLGSVLALAKVFLGMDFGVSEEDLFTVGSGVLVVYGMYNSWVTVATTEKIGLPDKTPNRN